MLDAARRTTIRRFAWAILGVGGPAIAAFVAGPLLARGLGPAGRGELAASIAILGLAAFVADLGLSNSFMVASARGDGVNAAVAKRIVSYYIATSVVSILVIVGLRSLGIVAFSNFVLIGIPIILIGNLLRSPITAKGLTSVLGAERWIQAFSRLGLLVVFVWAGHLTHSLAVVAHVTSLALPIVVLAWAYRRIPRTQAPPDINLLRFGLVTCGSGISSVVLIRLDQFILLPVAGAEQLGLYAVAAGLGEVPLLLSTALRMMYEGRIASSRSAAAVKAPIAICLVVGASIVLGSLIFGRWFINLLYGEQFAAAATTVTVLLLATTFAMVVDLCGASLVALGRPGAQWRVSGLAAAVTLALLYPLVANYGALGAAYVTLISYIVAAIASLFELRRADPTLLTSAGSRGPTDVRDPDDVPLSEVVK